MGMGVKGMDKKSLGAAIALMKKVGAGIKDHSVEGLTLTVVFQDDSTEEITFEQPTASDVAEALTSIMAFSVDETTGHLIVTIDSEETDLGNVKGDKGDSSVISISEEKVTFGI